jgi:putative glutamine amidotransferase
MHITGTKNINLMKKTVLIMFLTGFMLKGAAVGFPVSDPETDVRYIVLANPTTNNLEIVRFLIEKRIFRVNMKKTRFLGVYHKNQHYDFEKSREWIQTNAPRMFLLREIGGEISDSVVFSENGCTEEFRELFDRSAGILFFGGPDIQPGLYMEENTRSVVTDPWRHTFEVSLLFHLLGSSRNPGYTPWLNERPGYLVTGFCLGLQTMNVATGGTLVQDIPEEIYSETSPSAIVSIERENLHRNYWQELSDDKQIMGINLHTIRFTAHPFFGKEIRIRKGATPRIYSSHHQSIGTIGTGFDVTALSPDGKVIEGMAHRLFPNVFGVQFHPEVPALYEDRESWKFAPEEEPTTYHRALGKESVRFHKLYWKRISNGLNMNGKT